MTDVLVDDEIRRHDDNGRACRQRVANRQNAVARAHVHSSSDLRSRLLPTAGYNRIAPIEPGDEWTD